MGKREFCSDKRVCQSITGKPSATGDPPQVQNYTGIEGVGKA